jgi:hypothetical protein
VSVCVNVRSCLFALDSEYKRTLCFGGQWADWNEDDAIYAARLFQEPEACFQLMADGVSTRNTIIMLLNPGLGKEQQARRRALETVQLVKQYQRVA